MNKKGLEILNNIVIFIILNVIFFAILFLFVGRVATGAGLIEQVYAKQIALIINQAKPGTIIEIDIEEVYDLADKNKFNRLDTVRIDNEQKKVYVKVAEGKGYSFNFFTNNKVLWGLEKKSKKLHIEIK